jgi:SAM-dependent methyltransferase
MIPLNKQTYRKKMMTSRWDAALYDSRLGFVSGFGENLVDVLEPKPGERILDIGCGSGDLAARIAETGATVFGIDASPEMIAAARDKYGDRKEIEFHVAGAESFSIGEQVDAAFSNAALHWVKDARGAAASIWSAVRPVDVSSPSAAARAISPPSSGRPNACSPSTMGSMPARGILGISLLSLDTRR